MRDIQLSHAGDNRNLGLFTFRFEVCVERFDGWVVTDSHDRRHVQHSPHLATPTTYKSLAGFFT